MPRNPPHLSPAGDAVDLDVLTYNVEGLPWPARKSRAERLKEIQKQLIDLRLQGKAPPVVMLQEAFTNEAAMIATRTGYRNVVPGPSARQRSREPQDPLAGPLLSNRRFWKGERFPKLLSSGLYIMSDYPIISTKAEPFGKSECAGYDCLANKGMVHARALVPGAPRPIDLFNTHLNSRGSAGVSFERSGLAHKVQVKRFNSFVAARRDNFNPTIVSGDFNMRGSPKRFSTFELSRSYRLVHRYCHARRMECGVRVSWDGDAPWMDTQDLQGFADAGPVRVKPIAVQAMFDQPWKGKPLADHDGLLVRYRISWPPDLTVRLTGGDPSGAPPLPIFSVRHGCPESEIEA